MTDQNRYEYFEQHETAFRVGQQLQSPRHTAEHLDNMVSQLVLVAREHPEVVNASRFLAYMERALRARSEHEALVARLRQEDAALLAATKGGNDAE